MKMKSIEGLNYLLSSSPYFNSHELLAHWITKCMGYISQAERVLDINLVSSQLESFPRTDLAFLARCTNFRIIIKDIERELFSEQISKERVKCAHDYVKVQMHTLEHLNRVDKVELLQAAGYEMGSVVTGPYPLFVSLLSEYGGCSMVESIPIIKYFAFCTDVTKHQYCLSEFSISEVAYLKKALENLNMISPYLLFDVSMNVRLFGKIIPIDSFRRSQHVSLTTTYLPGIVFFSQGIFSSLEMVAESIFHECLHMKYIQTMEIYHLHPPSYTGDTGRAFTPSWRPEDNIWKFNRAFGAYHVYAHLCIYYNAILESSALPEGYRSDWITNRARECFTREQELRQYVLAEEEYAFTNEGMDFFHKIAGIVDKCTA